MQTVYNINEYVYSIHKVLIVSMYNVHNINEYVNKIHERVDCFNEYCS